MKTKNINFSNNFWFVLEVILIFVLIEGVAFAFGHLDAGTIALLLLLITALVFIGALFSARYKNKKHKNSFAPRL